MATARDRGERASIRPSRLVAATSDRLLERDDMDARLGELLAAGVPAVWLRTRAMDDRAFHELAVRVRERCTEHGAELWIGDRADVARLVGADVVQLPEAGLSVTGARRVVGIGMRIGRSVHAVEAVAGSIGEGVDHLVVGTMYPTTSHPDKVPEGPELLEEVREAAPGLPLYAIGGITPSRVGSLHRRGAYGVAAIGSLWDAANPSGAVRAFLDSLEATPGPALH